MRRIGLLLLFCAAGAGSRVVPTDIDTLNRFADEYNAYARQAQAGVIDTKQWQRVERAWRSMTGE